MSTADVTNETEAIAKMPYFLHFGIWSGLADCHAQQVVYIAPMSTISASEMKPEPTPVRCGNPSDAGQGK
jgi:hypothetical protein